MTDQTGRSLPITEAAKRLGIHANTLRSWADRGLVAYERLPSGYRRFWPADIEHLRREMRQEAARDQPVTEP